MSLASVQPGITSQAVHPGQDTHDDRNPRREQRQPGKDGEPQPDPHAVIPVVNDLGQLTGGTINITA